MEDILEEISHELVWKETEIVPFQERGTAHAEKQWCVFREFCFICWLM